MKRSFKKPIINIVCCLLIIAAYGLGVYFFYNPSFSKELINATDFAALASHIPELYENGFVLGEENATMCRIVWQPHSSTMELGHPPNPTVELTLYKDPETSAPVTSGVRLYSMRPSSGKKLDLFASLSQENAGYIRIWYDTYSRINAMKELETFLFNLFFKYSIE